MPPERLTRIYQPFERFFRWEASSGLILLAATITALVWVNAGAAATYTKLWETPAIVGIGPLVIEKPLLLWVNDGLMAVFFLLVGLEIKRELVTGELSDARSAALPVAAAVGGMVVPAAAYLAVTWGTPSAVGWGIPMATDIAFALGALAVFGRRLPSTLGIFLAALALVDDIGAVVVIALVYTPKIVWAALAVAAVALVLLVALNRLGVTSLWPYIAIGLVLWIAVLKSGVHATIAGVLLALTIPASAPARLDEVASESEALLQGEAAEEADATGGPRHDALLLELEDALHEGQSPLSRLEHALLPWVSFGIVPVFALANAGVRLDGSLVDALASPVSLGIVAGLVVGKQVGILSAAWAAVRSGIAQIPDGVTWRHLWGASCLAGIGFTMSLFVSALALPEAMLADAKLAILSASVIAGALGLTLLGTAAPADPDRRPAGTA